MYPYCIYLKLLCTYGILLYCNNPPFTIHFHLVTTNDKSSISYPCTSNMPFNPLMLNDFLGHYIMQQNQG